MGTVIRITVVGHASRRWKGAATQSEADRLNQQLSELRAQNLRKSVEETLKKTLPSAVIEVPTKGVGIHESFSTTGEDNAAVDRSVVIMIDLTTTVSSYNFVPVPPRKIYVPSKLWSMKVVGITSGGGIGMKSTFLKLLLKNSYTGKELMFSGIVTGGDLGPPSKKRLFKFDSKADPSKFGKQIGDEVNFSTPDAVDFDFWIGNSNPPLGQWVRLAHSHIKSGLSKTETTFLQFVGVDTHPGSLVFELTKLGFKLGFPDVDVYVATGKITADGPSPGDFLEFPSPKNIIPSQRSINNSEGILLMFPTGKASLSDLTAIDRSRLEKFVSNKALNFRDLVKNVS